MKISYSQEEVEDIVLAHVLRTTGAKLNHVHIDSYASDFAKVTFDPSLEAPEISFAEAIEQAKQDGYAEGRKDEREEHDKPKACKTAGECMERDFCQSENRCAVTLGEAA